MADKTLKSLNFGGADNYFPLPIVSANDNNKILSVVNGEWVVKEAPSCDDTGQYVWSKRDSADGPVTGYVISNNGEKYPDGGWSDGVFYTLELEPITYLTFTGNEDFTLKTYNTTKNWDGTLEYSTDTSTWNTWDGTEISSAGSKLYLRGTGNTKITSNSSTSSFVFTGTSALKIACEGNIENLLDYKIVSAGGHPTMADYCYGYMFQNCTALTTAPALPATTLSKGCYGYMFYLCASLTSAPELPATTLAVSCYSNMFRGCTSLATAPALPATTLADYCYRSMFEGCTALTTAPELPATTLAEDCYSSMFYKCTSLATAPALPATTLAGYCYNAMFSGCTALTTAPALPATTLANHCYDKMFQGCTALTTAPILPATTLANYCYQRMFFNCASIKLSTTQKGEYNTAYRIPKSGTGTTATNALKDMFANTGGAFKGTPEINTTYYLSTSNTVV